MTDELTKFIQDQLSVWPLASGNFRALKVAEVKDLTVGGIPAKAQHNPCRIGSTTAEVDSKKTLERPCFLCVPNRPKEQFHIKFDGRKGRRYNVQVNPYPIFPAHLVIARDVHVPQSVWHNFVDMMDFARKYPDYLVFYNGPDSGASAPDHMHYQAIPTGLLPLQQAIDAWLDEGQEPLATGQDAKLYHFPRFCRGVYALRSDTPKSLAKLFYRLVDCCPIMDGEPEPRLNLFTYCYKEEYRCFVVLRGAVRSHHYYSTGPDHLTMSPGAADMAGMFVCPRKEDYDKLTGALLDEILDEVCISAEDERMVAWRMTRHQPKVDVPIAEGKQITFEMISDGAGPQRVSLSEDGRIDYGGALYDELYFDSVTRSTVFAPASFIIHGEKPMQFAGSIRFTVEGGTIRASNHIGIENYLLSKLSEELSPDLPLEETKQAVIKRRKEIMEEAEHAEYKGLTIDILTNVRKAIDLTWGQQN